MKHTIYAFDTETHLIGPGRLAPKLVCCSVADATSTRLFDAADGLDWFSEHVTRDTVVGVNIFYDLGVLMRERPELTVGIFEAVDQGRVIDLPILEALHDNARGLIYRQPNGAPLGRYSLLVLENRYLGIDRSEQKHGENAWRLRYAELDGVPLDQWPEEAKQYPKADARNTFDVARRQIPELGAVDRLNYSCYVSEMRAGLALHLANVWGIRTDKLMVPEVVKAIKEEHESSRRRFFAAGIARVRKCTKVKGEYERADDIARQWLGEMIKAISETGAGAHEWVAGRQDDIRTAMAALDKGVPIRFAEDKKHLAALVERVYGPSAPRTEKGAIKTDRDTLAESGDPLLEAYAEAGENEKLLSTYVDVLEQGTKTPINPSTTVLVATDRVSYSRPNLQQLPRSGHVRECFVSPGKVLVSVDYNMLELCTLAEITYQWFGASVMRDAINAGQDLHLRFAARIAGCTYAEALARKKEPLMKNYRQSAKPVNFGLPGLMGAPKIVATARKQDIRFCELAGAASRCGEHDKLSEWGKRTIPPTCADCLHIAKRYSDIWFSEYPEVRAYHEQTVRMAREGDTGVPIESMGNGMLRLETNPNAVSNHYFQNLAAQGAKHAAWNLQREAYTDENSVLFNNTRLLVFIHDETLCEHNEGALTEAAARQREIMVSSMQEFCPNVTIRAEEAAARRWFKGMETVRDAAGNLVPWWPKDWAWEPDQEVMAQDLARVIRKD